MFWIVSGIVVASVIMLGYFIAVFIAARSELKRWGELDGEFIVGTVLVFSLLAVVAALFLTPMAGRIEHETDLREYERYQEMVEHVYKSEDETLSYAMNIKITEYNEKLADWQNRQDRWGYWFSLVPPRVQELEYIKLEGGD